MTSSGGLRMYLAVVVLTMVVLPVGAVLRDGLAATYPDWVTLIGKWFVFYAVGVRLSLAGVRQYVQPAFTSRDILGVDSPQAYVLVRELGGANLSAGLVALASLFWPSFVLPCAIASGLFYAIAGVEHLKSRERGLNENVALWSDLYIAVILLGYAALALSRGGD